MRKSTIPVAVAIVAALSLPAQAAKYACTFSQDNNQVGTCSVDSANPNKFCEHIFSPAVTATCAAQPVGVNLLACVLHDPNLKPTELVKAFAKSSSADIAQALAEQKGFISEGGSVGQGADWPSNIIIGYQQGSTTPLLLAICK
jgi:hypothetical protein